MRSHGELLGGTKRKACAHAASAPASAPSAAAAAGRRRGLSPEGKRPCSSAQPCSRPRRAAANPRDRAGLLCAESLPDAGALCSPSTERSSSGCAASCSFYTGSGAPPRLREVPKPNPTLPPARPAAQARASGPCQRRPARRGPGCSGNTARATARMHARLAGRAYRAQAPAQQRRWCCSSGAAAAARTGTWRARARCPCARRRRRPRRRPTPRPPRTPGWPEACPPCGGACACVGASARLCWEGTASNLQQGRQCPAMHAQHVMCASALPCRPAGLLAVLAG